jgi:hypothetical protein
MTSATHEISEVALRQLFFLQRTYDDVRQQILTYTCKLVFSQLVPALANSKLDLLVSIKVFSNTVHFF